MRHLKLSSKIAALLCFSAFAAVGAYADQTQTWVLTGSNGSPPCSASSPCAQVTIDINSAGTQATFTVTSLVNNYVFDTFGFNESGGGTLTLVSSSGDVNRRKYWWQPLWSRRERE